MRTEPLFQLKQNRMTNRKKVTIGLIITGILSLIVLLITIYGQFTGTFLIKLTYAAERKGILLSTDSNFTDSTDKLILTPVSNVEDMIESNLIHIDEILASEGGQYVDPDGNENYVAYTFFIKNTGAEVVDIRYDLMIVKQYKHLDDAITTLMYIDYLDDSPIEKIRYNKTDGKRHLGTKKFQNFMPNDVYKITIISFIDGELSNPSMLGGAVKINLVFTVETAG